MIINLKLPALVVFSSFVMMCFLPNIAISNCADDLENLVGYTIVDSKTITGWRDDDEKEDSSFNGCTHGRIIFFSDGKKLTCAEYGYMYAYRPTAIIFARELSVKGKKFMILR